MPTKEQHYAEAMGEVEARLLGILRENLVGRIRFTFHIEGGKITRLYRRNLNLVPGPGGTSTPVFGPLFPSLDEVLRPFISEGCWAKVTVLVLLSSGRIDGVREEELEESVRIGAG